MRARLVTVLIAAAPIALGGCAGMTETEQRTLSGAAIGTGAGLAVSAITGEWAWTAAGAAVGAAGGYIYDQQKKKEQTAYDQGVEAGKQQAQQQKQTQQ